MESGHLESEGEEDHRSSGEASSGATPPPPSPAEAATDNESSEGIEVGFFYEIDHEMLPRRSPAQLRSLRAVMVSDKTELTVTVTFPSTGSSNRIAEKFLMGTKLAGKVLFRRLPVADSFQEKVPRRFWHTGDTSGCGDGAWKNGTCWRELKGTGMMQWGTRRLVKFIGRHKEKKKKIIKSCSSNHQDSSEMEIEEGDDGDAYGEKLKMEEDDGGGGGALPNKKSLKRKRNASGGAAEKHDNGKGILCVVGRRKKSSQKVLKNSKDRWSAERYKLAEKNMLEILRAKRAVFGNPILRSELRSEARKKIGDTGLLDHLLKHMAGKLAPGGVERFRRRHNADGAMEYWLESGELVRLRKEAGVKDPYWMPPPGWQPGDSPTQDPVCARELKLLREEIAKIKREMQEVVSRRQEESEANDNGLAVIPKSCVTELSMAETDSLSLLPLKEKHGELLSRKLRIEKQLMEISDCLSQVQGEMMGMTMLVPSSVENSRRSPETPVQNDSRRAQNDGKRAQKEAQLKAGDQLQKDKAETATSIAVEEEEEDKNKADAAEAAKGQRIRSSGFRLCKPRGTFLWPNSSSSSSGTATISTPQVVVAAQLQDPFVVPTPPSAAPTRLPFPSPLPPPPLLPLPVKPLAERRGVKVTVSAVPRTVPAACGGAGEASGWKKPPFFNLNEVPTPAAAADDGGACFYGAHYSNPRLMECPGPQAINASDVCGRGTDPLGTREPEQRLEVGGLPATRLRETGAAWLRLSASGSGGLSSSTEKFNRG